MFNNSGINKAILVGVIHSQPERITINKETFLCFQLVTSESFTKQGIIQDHFEYHYIKLPVELVWDDVENWIKGAGIHLEGKIVTLSRVDEMGIKRYDTTIAVSRCNLMKAPKNSSEFHSHF